MVDTIRLYPPAAERSDRTLTLLPTVIENDRSPPPAPPPRPTTNLTNRIGQDWWLGGEAGREADWRDESYSSRLGLRGNLAAVPCSLDAQRSGPRLPRSTHRGRCRDPPGLRPARPQTGRRDLAPGSRPASLSLAQAGRADGRQRTRRARLHGLSPTAPHQAPQHKPDRASEQRGEATSRCRRNLPERSLNHSPDRRGAVRAERRMADRQPLHAGRGLRQVEAFAQIDHEEMDPILSITTQAA
jgi:hypothetical protein